MANPIPIRTRRRPPSLFEVLAADLTRIEMAEQVIAREHEKIRESQRTIAEQRLILEELRPSR